MGIVNEHPTFASRFRELCGVEEQNELSVMLDVTKNTFRQWTNSNATPTMEKLIKLAEYFNVSVDYLTGKSPIKSPEIETRAAVLRYGLSEVGLSELSAMPLSEMNHGAEHINAMNRKAETMTYRAIINLLLSSEHGKKALRLLSSYYFASFDSRRQESLPVFVLPWEMPDNGGTWFDTAILSEVLQREILLDLAKSEFRELQREREEVGG